MTNIQIQDLWKYNLRAGNTDHPSNGACLFDAGMWLVYGKIGDNPPCSCPIIRAYGIKLNDKMNNKQRQLLKPFILRIVGNRDTEVEPERIRFIVLETARKIIPIVFDKKWPNLAKEAREIPNDIGFKELKIIMNKLKSYAAADAAAYSADAANAAAYTADAAADAADAANAAAYAAYAAAYAAAAYAATYAAYAAAADAAADAANAAAYTANAAAYTADAAAYTADAAAAVWKETIWILDNVLKIGKQSPEYDEVQIRKAIKEFDLASMNV